MRYETLRISSEEKSVLIAALNEYKACNMGPSAEDIRTMDIPQKTLDHYHWLHRHINDLRRKLQRAFRKR